VQLTLFWLCAGLVFWELPGLLQGGRKTHACSTTGSY
jgi:hypothetical protein